MKILVLNMMTLTLFGCGGGSPCADIEPNQRDSKNLVEYSIPAGWTNTRISTRNHFTREGRPNDATVLGVVATTLHSSITIEQIKEGTTGKHELQGRTRISEVDRSMNGFTVWETVYEAKIRTQEVIFHDIFLFAKNLQVVVNLNTTKTNYQSYLPGLLAVADSVCILSEESGK